MKSPFPGMDPYLEQHWSDVHARLIGYVSDELSSQLPGDLVGRIEGNIVLEDREKFLHKSARPDVFVATGRGDLTPSDAGATAVLDEPIYVEPMETTRIERSIRITDLAGNNVVTVIEILSPWNKTPASARRAYQKKRSKYLQGHVNLVEIDLIRAGHPPQLVGGFGVFEAMHTTYRVSVVKAGSPGMYVYPIPLTSRLPTIAVPLRMTDKPAVLALQGLLDQAYERGRYAGTDYTRACVPPLKGSDLVIATQILSAAGKIRGAV